MNCVPNRSKYLHLKNWNGLKQQILSAIILLEQISTEKKACMFVQMVYKAVENMCHHAGRDAPYVCSKSLPKRYP